MNEITMITIDKLKHHPENPRLDLGDLTELTASIKANGILQNLTVVPGDDEYLVVIGNRRLEAAARAGVTELPCVVSDMDRKDQIATMLQENMQRSDLTLYEQAKGVQMMMDIGFDKAQISERTGLSRTTIERRLAIAALPEEETKHAVSCGYDLLDLIEISKLESRKKQIELLQCDHDLANDPARLRMHIRIAQQTEVCEREKKRLLPEIEKFAKPMPDPDKRFYSCYEYLNKYDVRIEPGAKVKTPTEEGNYFYFEAYCTYEIWRKVRREKRVKTDEETAREKRKHDAKEMNERMRDNRIAFVSGFTPNKAQEANLKDLMWEYVFDNVSNYQNGNFLCCYHGWDTELFRKLCDMPAEDGRDMHETIMAELKRRKIPMGRAILAWMLCGGVVVCDSSGYASEYDGTYKPDRELDMVYRILTDNGYVMSEQERQWKDGTHPFYADLAKKAESEAAS